MNRRSLALAPFCGLLGGLLYPLQAALSASPKLAKKAKYRVGFAQAESNNPWRLAETQSMTAEAKRLGVMLVTTDAGGSAAKQVADIRSMIAQRLDLIFVSPLEERPLTPVVKEATRAGIPVILLDRNIDPALAKAGEDYLSFIGSDFVDEGRRVAEWLIKASGGRALVIQLEGTTGASPANDRKKGFNDALAGHPGIKILASQSGDFARDKGRQVAQTLLQTHPSATVIYAHNDEMAIGAVVALEAAGKRPGKDVMVLSIDGGREAVRLVAEGKINYIVECNPKFGPKAFAAMLDHADGKPIPGQIVNPDREFDAANAKALLSSAY